MTKMKLKTPMKTKKPNPSPEPTSGLPLSRLICSAGQRKMDDVRIRQLVDELDRSIPKEGAVIAFRQYGGGPDESKIVGSRVGLLRAGVELLREGVGSAGERKEEQGLVALHAITHPDSEIQFDYFEEKPLPEDRAQEVKVDRIGKIIGVSLLCIVLLTIGFAIYGVTRLFS